MLSCINIECLVAVIFCVYILRVKLQTYSLCSVGSVFSFRHIQCSVLDIWCRFRYIHCCSVGSDLFSVLYIVVYFHRNWFQSSIVSKIFGTVL